MRLHAEGDVKDVAAIEGPVVQLHLQHLKPVFGTQRLGQGMGAADIRPLAVDLDNHHPGAVLRPLLG